MALQSPSCEGPPASPGETLLTHSTLGFPLAGSASLDGLGRPRREQDLGHGTEGHFFRTPGVFCLGAETLFPILVGSWHPGFHSLSPVREHPPGLLLPVTFTEAYLMKERPVVLHRPTGWGGESV